jgi:putative hydrolase of the HAD superfamily
MVADRQVSHNRPKKPQDPERPGAVLVDLYGTLVDVEVDESSPSRWNRIIDKMRKPGADSMLDAEAGYETYLRLCEVARASDGRNGILPSVFRQMLVLFGYEGTIEQVRAFAVTFRRATLVKLDPRIYTSELLEMLRSADLQIGLVSNTESILTASDLVDLELVDAFDTIVLSSDIGVEKPDVSIFQTALTNLNCDPTQSVMVGDTWATDVVGALSAGLRVLYLGGDEGASHDLRCQRDLAGVSRIQPGFDEIRSALAALGFPVPR